MTSLLRRLIAAYPKGDLVSPEDDNEVESYEMIHLVSVVSLQSTRVVKLTPYGYSSFYNVEVGIS